MWNRISNIIRKIINKQPVYVGKYLNTRLDSSNCNKNILLWQKNTQNESLCFCLAGIVLDFVYRINKEDDKHYPQI